MAVLTRTFNKGEVIFSEGSTGQAVYLVRAGLVEITREHDGKHTVLARLGSKEVIGELAILPRRPRTVTATAVEFTELLVLDRPVLTQMFERAPKPVTSILQTLAKRLDEALQQLAEVSRPSSDIVAYARLLELLSRTGQEARPMAGRGAKTEEQPSSVLRREVLEYAETLLGQTSHRARAVLKQMAGLHLITLQGVGEQMRIEFQRTDIIKRAEGLEASVGEALGGRLMAYLELLDAGAAADRVGVTKEQMLRKVARNEFTDDLIVFRRQILDEILATKGKSFFAERKRKSPEEFSELEDIEFLDRNTLHKAIAKFDPLELAKLMYGREDAVRQRIHSCLTEKRRADLKTEEDAIGEPDYVEVTDLEARLLNAIKQIAT